MSYATCLHVNKEIKSGRIEELKRKYIYCKSGKFSNFD